MIGSIMTFCRTVGTVHSPLAAPIMRQGGYCSMFARLQPASVGVGLQRISRACTAAAATDGVAVRNTWGKEDRTAEIRELGSMHEWIARCGNDWEQFSPYEGYAAIRKLVELLRHGRSRIEVNDKLVIRDALDGIFQLLEPQVSAFEPTDQQILVLELSQLGIVFISQEWHDCSPAVPKGLLNGLLDGLLMRLRKLRGDQVGVLLISLQRLQLSDRAAYTKILDEIERQLKGQASNSWYRQTETMGKLVRGVATVFLGIPKGLDREQACRVLNVMAEEVRQLAGAARGSDDASFWSSASSIMESYLELYSVLPGLLCHDMLEQIGKVYIDSMHALDARGLVQVARVYSTKPFSRLECSKQVITKLCKNMRRAGEYSELGGACVAEVAECLSLGADKDVARVQALMEWILGTPDSISNEAGLRMLAAAARVGLVASDSQWKLFTERYGATVMQPPPHYNSQYDRELLLMLDAAISCSLAEASVHKLVQAAAGWMDAGKLRLWRIAPYLTVMSRGSSKYKASAELLFERALDAIKYELSSGMIMAQRGQLMLQALAAFIVLGKSQYVEQLLSMDNVTASLEEQGGSAAAGLAHSIIDAARVEGPELVAAQLDVKTVQLVWEKMLHMGAEMAAAAGFDGGPPQQPSPFDALPPRTLCQLFMVLYEGQFDRNIVASMEPNAALLASIPESIAAEFSSCGENDEKCTRAWMNACLHLFDIEDFPILTSFRRSLGQPVAPAESVKSQPAATAEPTIRDKLKALTVIKLKEKLAGAGLKVSGSKPELINRLVEHSEEVAEDALAAEVPQAPTTLSPLADTSAAPTQPTAATHAPADAATDAADAPAESPTDAPADAAGAPADAAALQKKTVPQLKALLRENKLKVSGNKADLVDRCLANALHA